MKGRIQVILSNDLSYWSLHLCASKGHTTLISDLPYWEKGGMAAQPHTLHAQEADQSGSGYPKLDVACQSGVKKQRSFQK